MSPVLLIALTTPAMGVGFHFLCESLQVTVASAISLWTLTGIQEITATSWCVFFGSSNVAGIHNLYSQSWPQCVFCSVTRRNLMLPPLGQSQTCGSTICKDTAMTIAQNAGQTQHSSRPFSASTNTYGMFCCYIFFNK